MILTEDIKTIAEQAPFVPIATASAQGQPHLIVVGKVKEVRGEDTLVFGIYKMEVTQKNLAANSAMQVVLAAKAEGPKGYRLSGTANVVGQEVIFKAEKAESLL